MVEGKGSKNQPERAKSVPLSLVYEGPEYEGVISAAELATILEGVAEYSQVAAAIGSNAATKVTPKVTALTSGSFDLHLAIEVVGVARDVATVVGVFGGAFAFWWKYMRTRVVDYTHDAERGMFKVILGTGEALEWTEAEWKLYNSHRARIAVRKMIRPLRERAARMRVETRDTVFVIEAEDSGRFEELPADGPIISRFTVSATPDTVRFDPAKAWRLESRDLGGFTATIEDKDFLTGIELNRISVRKHDTFVLAVRSELDSHNDSRPRYFVERVIQHLPGGEQHELPSGENA